MPTVLSIDFTPTLVETLRELINRITTTGPTMTAGIVEETADTDTSHKSNSISLWVLKGWEQFKYHIEPGP